MTDDPALKPAVGWIASFEGFRAMPYQDQGGVWTIGYGVTFTSAGHRVTAATPSMTKDAAYARLTVDVASVLAAVRRLVDAEVPLSANQASALTSLAYNIGIGAFGGSTLLRLLNSGNYLGAADQFGNWVHVGSQVSKGLVQRRMGERALFLIPDVPTKPAPDPTAAALSAFAMAGFRCL